MSERSSPPPEPTFFIDRCLGFYELPAILREAGMQIRTHKEAGYVHDTEDVVWIPEVAAAGLVILTKDKDIRRTRLELVVTLEAKAFYFTLGKADRSAKENARIILHHRRTIERLVAHSEPPVIAQINGGEVLRRLPNGTLKEVKRRA